MPQTNDPGDAARAEYLRETQASQGGGSRGEAPVGAPDRNTLSPGGRGLVDVRDTVVGHMGQYYKNPEAAYDNLMREGENKISDEDVRRDPGLLGELRGDRRPGEREIGGYLAGRETRDQSTQTSRQEADGYHAQQQAHNTQSQERALAQKDNTMDDKLNNVLSLNQSNLTI